MLRTEYKMRGLVPSCSPVLEAVSGILKRPRGLAIAFFLASAFIAGPAAAQRMYKCTDAKGKTYYTQLPPQECLGRESSELNKAGTVVQKNEAMLTPEQLAAREAERKKKAEEEEKAKEERRKNAALLNTYSSEKDIDEARARALKQAEEAIKQSEKRLADAQKRRKDLDSEKEFYAKRELPPKLAQELKSNDIELKTQNELLDAKKKEIVIANAKYDEDKRRYLELTRGSVPASAKK